MCCQVHVKELSDCVRELLGKFWTYVRKLTCQPLCQPSNPCLQLGGRAILGSHHNYVSTPWSKLHKYLCDGSPELLVPRPLRPSWSQGLLGWEPCLERTWLQSRKARPAGLPYSGRRSWNLGRCLNRATWRSENHSFFFEAMFSGLCDESGPFDFGSPCVRASWGAVIPAVFVFGLCFLSSPLVSPFRKLLANHLGSSLKPFLTIQEAEALCVDEEIRRDDGREVVARVERLSRWHAVVLIAIGLLESLSWTIFGAFQHDEDPTNVWVASIPFFISVSWLYSAIRPMVQPINTSPYDLFVLYGILFSAAVLRSWGILHDQIFFGVPLPTNFTSLVLIADLVCAFVGLGTTLAMPLGIPDPAVDKNEIVCRSSFSSRSSRLYLAELTNLQGYSVSPEDYTSLWRWITFRWLNPLLHQVGVLK